MSTLTTIFAVVAGMIIVLLVIAAFINKEMTIERNIVIDRPKQEVFDYIKFVRNHDNFSAWAKMDPDMKKEYRGTDGQAGFVYAWDSSKKKNVGAGEQEIKKIIPGESIEFDLRFKRPMQDIALAKIITETVSAYQTKVQWGFYSKMKFPLTIMKPLIQNMLGKNLETGLANLKSTLEKA